MGLRDFTGHTRVPREEDILWNSENEYGLEPFWLARKALQETHSHHEPISPSEIWEVPEDFDATAEFVCPSDAYHTAIYTRVSYKYPHFLLRTSFPELPASGSVGDLGAWFGCENDSRAGQGLAAFYWNGSEINVGVAGAFFSGASYRSLAGLGIDGTVTHIYEVIVTERGVEFYIDRELVAYFTNAPMLYDPNISPPPYGVYAPNQTIATDLHGIIELEYKLAEEVRWEVHPYYLRGSDSTPSPPRVFQLYDWKSDTLMTSGTYTTGSYHYSHPFPLLGNEEEYIHFQADNYATDGLIVQHLTQEGNWRTILSKTPTGDAYVVYDIGGPRYLGRVGYQPSADGASIDEAEVIIH